MSFLTVTFLTFLTIQVTDDSAQSSTSKLDVIPEWSRAKGVLITYPFSLPNELVKDFAADTHMTILVKEENLAKAKKELNELGIGEQDFTLLICSVDSEWTRDWGPHQVLTKDGRFGIVDPDFDGYPAYRSDGKTKAEFTYRTGKGDDKVNAEIGKLMKVPVDYCPAFVTGGNFLVDGMGTAFCTRAILQENSKKYDQSQLQTLLQGELGINRLVILENTEKVGIQHIDCWMKVLDPETLLIKRAPDDHVEATNLEKNVAKLAKLKNGYGRPYRIIRIDCPRVKVQRYYPEADPIAAYTNSLILNDKVYVPLFNVDGDENALQTWRDSLPGYEVEGYPFDKWMDFDALHCRTRALFDPNTLSIQHPKLPVRVRALPKGISVEVAVFASEKSGDGVTCELHFREKGDDEWAVQNMLRNNKSNRWTTTFPALKTKTRYEYFIKAKDSGARSAMTPPIAPKAVYSFEVLEK